MTGVLVVAKYASRIAGSCVPENSAQYSPRVRKVSTDVAVGSSAVTSPMCSVCLRACTRDDKPLELCPCCNSHLK